MQDMPYEYSEEYTLEGNRIHDLLLKVYRHSSPLDLCVGNENKKRITTITDIDIEAGTMRLDLPPGRIQKTTLKNCRFSIYGEMDGVSFSFDSSFTDKTLEAIIPEKIFYLQRRLDYRVHVRLGDGVIIKLPTGNGDLINGTVRNLSAGGLGMELRFTVSELPEWHKGQILEDCVLNFNRGQSLKCNLKICHIESKKNHHCSVGTQFLELDPGEKRKLRQYVMELEREHKRLAVLNDPDK